MLKPKTIAHFTISSGEKFRIKDHPTLWTGDKRTGPLDEDEVKEVAKKRLEESIEDLSEAQELLFAADRWSVLCIFQAMDAAGKDGTIRHVLSGVNPAGCDVHSFKQPSSEEIDHTFLWRHMRRVPERGRIGIFNRSYYEDVLVVKVHQGILDTTRLTTSTYDDKFWQGRYDDINNFERHLVRNGTLVLKFFLNVGKDEQKKRFIERMDTPEKQWKFSAGDVRERQHWDKYMRAYEDAINATSTSWAPWYVVPADNKWIMRMVVAEIMAAKIQELKIKYPKATPEQLKELDAARKQLDSE
jgi:PPK2 family polyphosphate:nucleotide phosphotransferase